MNETANTSNTGPDVADEYQVKLARAMRRALKRAADYAMQHDDAAEAANEALALLRAEFVGRFELVRSRQRQPTLIVPEPLSPAMSNASNYAINLSQRHSPGGSE